MEKPAFGPAKMRHAPLLSFNEALAYIKMHAVPVPGSNFGLWTIETPMPVFKGVLCDKKKVQPSPFNHITRYDDGDVHRYRKAICNLIIPIGATISTAVFPRYNHYPSGSRGDIVTEDYKAMKMRASSAIVHSVVRISTCEEVDVGHSIYRAQFEYRKGCAVLPESEFNRDNTMCASGIHFFLQVRHALEYMVYQGTVRKG